MHEFIMNNCGDKMLTYYEIRAQEIKKSNWTVFQKLWGKRKSNNVIKPHTCNTSKCAQKAVMLVVLLLKKKAVDNCLWKCIRIEEAENVIKVTERPLCEEKARLQRLVSVGMQCQMLQVVAFLPVASRGISV